MIKEISLRHILILVFLFFIRTAFAQSVFNNIRVMVWLSAECPLSQKYTLTLTKIEKHFSGKGIDFISVFPDDRLKDIRKFENLYKFHWKRLSDQNGTLTEKYAARITPEVVVLDKDGIIVYRGAIDDQVIALGKFREKASQHYLLNALESLMANKQVEIKETKPVGCIIN